MTWQGGSVGFVILERALFRLSGLGALIHIRRQFTDGLDVTAQLVGDYDPWFAKPGDQFLEEPLCSFCISPSLHENVEYVAICVDCTPQPMFLATDCDHDLVEVPLVVRQRSIP